jgi:uncharacterized membrane protein HdeD (DUF308 family)
MTPQTRHRPASRQTALLQRRQGNILIAGILSAATGGMFFCHVVAVSDMSWPVVGLILITTGLLQLHAIWQIREYMPLAIWALTTIIYVLFGIFALTGPTARFALLSLIFFAGLVAMGILRGHCAYLLRFSGHGWRWLLGNATVTVTIGLYLAAHWPFNDLSLASQLLALDLAAHGLALVGFSIQLGRSAA